MLRRKTQAETNRLNHHIIELLFRQTTRFFAVFVFLLLAAVMTSLVFGSWDSFSTFGFSFLWHNDWNPVQESYGAIIPIVGTLITSFLALIIAVPISFGIAIFLTELAPEWLRRPVGTAIEMLAAIPSIIYGMWDFSFCTTFPRTHPTVFLLNGLAISLYSVIYFLVRLLVLVYSPPDWC